jgi:uncharacterized repeat protein (TIGR02543 family)
MKKYISLFIAVILIAALIGCHAGGNAPFAQNNGETTVLPETRVVGANGRFSEITFPSGAVIKCPNNDTFKEGVRVTASEQKVPIITDNSGKFSYIYVYNISAVLPAENSLSSDVPVNTVEKPLSVTLPNGSTAGTCYIGTRASENEPWRFSLVSDGNVSNARFMRLSAKSSKTCTFDLYRLNVQFRLFAFDNEDSDKGEVDSVALSTGFEDNKITVKDGKYTEDLEIKITLYGEKLDSINAYNLIARIIYRSSSLNPVQLKANGSIVKQTDSDDKAVTGGYEHSFEISNIRVDSQMSGEAVLSFVLNLNGVTLEDFPTDFLVEFYSDTKDEKALPFTYTQFFSFATKEEQVNPEPQPGNYALTVNSGIGIASVEGAGNYKAGESVTVKCSIKDGYEFDSWSGDKIGSTIELTFNMPENNVTVTANAKVITYNISYNIDGGQLTKDNPSNYTVETDDIPLTNPTKNGYTFKGWSGTGLTGDENTSVTIAQGSTGDRTYTANWNENPPDTYTLTLVAGTGIASVDNEKAYSKDTSITLNCTVKDGYEFEKWTNSNGDTVTSPFTMPAEAVTLIANAKAITYKITYELDGGQMTADNPQNYTVETADFNLPTPTKDYYNFLGWSLNNGKPVTPVTIAQGTHEDRTYTANWSINCYNLTINKGTGIATITGNGNHEYNSTVTASCTMLAGYEFDKWTGDFTEETFTMPANNATMTANAKLIEYKISYITEGGVFAEGVASPTLYTVASEAFTLPTPTRNNYKFLGWCLNSGAPVESVEIAQGTHESRTYVASWTMADTLTFTLAEGVTLEMKRCPAGTFTMGSPTTENGRDDDETQHSVTISKDFWMGTYEVTQAQYRAIMGSNPSDNTTGDESVLPVERVTWNDIMTDSTGFNAMLNASLTAQLAQLPGSYKFDLPTEAQWEYACRAGTQGQLNYFEDNTKSYDDEKNIGAVAWYSSNSSGTTHEVGKKKDNDWGLYDMHGNVWEWCKDMYGESYYQYCIDNNITTDPFCDSGSDRVGRGGGWIGNAGDCRSAFRSNGNPGYRFSYLGFRLALVPVVQ